MLGRETYFPQILKKGLRCGGWTWGRVCVFGSIVNDSGTWTPGANNMFCVNKKIIIIKRKGSDGRNDDKKGKITKTFLFLSAVHHEDHCWTKEAGRLPSECWF